VEDVQSESVDRPAVAVVRLGERLRIAPAGTREQLLVGRAVDSSPAVDCDHPSCPDRGGAAAVVLLWRIAPWTIWANHSGWSRNIA
jgi:hypothetical protein